MLCLVLVASCLGALGRAAWLPLELEEAEAHFARFVAAHDKRYTTDFERDLRFQIFKDNLRDANERNARLPYPVYGITPFSDLTEAEFSSMYMGLSTVGVPGQCKQFLGSSNFSVPEAFDWRSRNVVTAVKNQKGCGGCYSFSAIGNIESQNAIKTGNLIELSKSQIIDCDTTSNGCVSGFNSNAILYAQRAGGVMSEADYPFVERKNPCRFNPSKVAVRVTGCLQYYTNSEEEIKAALVSNGPLSVAVDASNWRGYIGSVYPSCSQSRNNHAVLLVGYGTEGSTPYWTIKNSWGPQWGEQGYIRIPRNRNACLVATGTKVTATV